MTKGVGFHVIVYRELSTLESDLAIPAKTLYALSNSLDRHYRRVLLPKPDGTFRRLDVPDEVLKRVQRRIAQRILAYMPVSPYATAYRYGTRPAWNAGVHLCQPVLLKLDIRHFFDSILYTQIKDMVFPASVFSEPIRILLSMLCYYQDRLPQGAPSSPAITNILMRGFDERVGAFCDAQGIRYTRYCDDMSFSGSFDGRQVRRFVEAELRGLGFFLNPAKTHLVCRGQRQCVTGLVVNDKLSVPADYRRQLRQELYYCRKFGIGAHLERIGENCTAQEYARRLLGRIDYVLQFSPQSDRLRQERDWLVEQLSR